MPINNFQLEFSRKKWTRARRHMLQEPSIEASLYQGKKEGLRLEGHHIQQDLYHKQVKWDIEVVRVRMFKIIFNT